MSSVLAMPPEVLVAHMTTSSAAHSVATSARTRVVPSAAAIWSGCEISPAAGMPTRSDTVKTIQDAVLAAQTAPQRAAMRAR